MAVYRAYFDETGTHEGATLLIVGGTVAKVSSWISFDAHWSAVLSRYGIAAFHAKDYNTKHGEFTEDRLPDTERPLFMNKLFSVIRAEKLFGFGSILETEDFARAKSRFPAVSLSPYEFLCLHCLSTISQLLATRKGLTSIEVYFESGQPKSSNIIKDARRFTDDPQFRKEYHISVIDWMRKSGVRPFELADLIIYEQYKAHRRMKTGEPREARPQARQLNSTMNGHFHKLSFDEVNALFGILAKWSRP